MRFLVFGVAAVIATSGCSGGPTAQRGALPTPAPTTTVSSLAIPVVSGPPPSTAAALGGSQTAGGPGDFAALQHPCQVATTADVSAAVGKQLPFASGGSNYADVVAANIPEAESAICNYALVSVPSAKAFGTLPPPPFASFGIFRDDPKKNILRSYQGPFSTYFPDSGGAEVLASSNEGVCLNRSHTVHVLMQTGGFTISTARMRAALALFCARL